MNNLQLLLSQVISNPDEDLPRLMYADELQESGEEYDILLAEYIRNEIKLFNHKRNVLVRKDNKVQGLTISYDSNQPKIDSYNWYREGIELKKKLNKLFEFLYTSSKHTFRGILNGYTYERGFIISLSINLKHFLTVHNDLIWHESMGTPCPLTAHPIKEIIIICSNRSSATPTDRYEIEKWEREYSIKYGISIHTHIPD